MVRNGGFGQIMEEGDSPGFFKILRREDLSSQLIRMIPHDIIRSISDDSSSFKMVLKVPWGSSWTVKISKNPSFHYMEDDGWNQFVNNNALGENEYLTCTHEGNMRFNVNIYGPDGTEMLEPRESATIASSSGMNKREQRERVYKHVKEEIVSSSESSYYSIKRAQGKKQEPNLGKKKAEESKKNKKSMKKKKKVDNDLEEGTSSLVPEFSITIRKSHLVFLGVPKVFVEMHMAKKTKWFKIRPEGKDSWDVLFLVTDAQSRFSAGWSRLSRELGLVVGDVCTFKLIKPTEMLVKVSRHDDEDDDIEEDDDSDEEEAEDADEDDSDDEDAEDEDDADKSED
ncbi:B3 domain-containing protein At5g18000-like [Brassica napus]|uniref:B3 domain-containing protein At5g18000-like n=1 Tax=Brassica napus TaxID=3708 RepID=UPI0020788E42|nr:B3 domain-containing protein At5g18000-like [Brassica napus]